MRDHSTSTRDHSPTPLALRYLADGIAADARSCGIYFGDRKVFLASIPGIDLADAECVQMLDELRRMQLLTFARADLVAAMDPELVVASEWTISPGVTAHFLVVS